MAGRNASSAWLAELAKERTEPFHLFEAHFDSGVVRATDAPFAIAWGGNSYLANGHFLAFSGITENKELRETRCTVTLSGVDQAWIANALEQNYLDRRLVIYKAFLEHQGSIGIDPVPLFDGLMDYPVIEEDADPASPPSPGVGNCRVTVEAGAHWSDFGRRPGRHTNDVEQQLHFSGDKFFEFVSEQNRQIMWGGTTGGAAPAPAVSTGRWVNAGRGGRIWVQ